MSDVLENAWRRYLRALQTNPLRTKAITAGCLAGCSDTVAQKLHGAKHLNLKRLALIFLYGLCYAGPFGHFFHKLMECIFQGRRDGQTIVKKVALEQAFSGPWNNFFFMVYFGLIVEGRPWGFVRDKIKRDYATVQLNSWRIWPIVGLINYRYMPVQLRVLFHGVAAACWGVFLSLKARSITLKEA